MVAAMLQLCRPEPRPAERACAQSASCARCILELPTMLSTRLTAPPATVRHRDTNVPGSRSTECTTSASARPPPPPWASRSTRSPPPPSASSPVSAAPSDQATAPRAATTTSPTVSLHALSAAWRALPGASDAWLCWRSASAAPLMRARERRLSRAQAVRCRRLLCLSVAKSRTRRAMRLGLAIRRLGAMDMAASEGKPRPAAALSDTPDSPPAPSGPWASGARARRARRACCWSLDSAME
mmetsp:Transcript_413/g.1068  ORF Transcript_413/g.1068 Transcript_413/m.1068 type:complete len:241 (-) Transcript_413:626-1348(-)